MTNRHSTTESTKTIYQGRIFALEVDRVRLPSGHVVDMEIVRHPGSVVLLPMPAPDRIILIRQYRYSIDRWIWELPAGSLKPDEDPDRAAARECEEEIGRVPGLVEGLRGFFPTPGFCELEPRTCTVAEARAMIDAGEIIDLKTVVGLTLI
jgi:ADP-ribose pyrophosphatase